LPSPSVPGVSEYNSAAIAACVSRPMRPRFAKKRAQAVIGRLFNMGFLEHPARRYTRAKSKVERSVLKRLHVKT